jgi:hypothetical protein
MTDFVELQREAAHELERTYSSETIYTAWPLTAALRRPEFGYVHHPLKTSETSDLHYSTLSRLDPQAVRVLVLYSRTWEPDWGVLQQAQVQKFLGRFYQYEPQMDEQQCHEKLGLIQVGRWARRGQFAEIYAKP